MDVKAFVRANADRVAAVALVTLGGVALVLGWIGVSGTGLAAEQNPYLLSGGVGGIALIAVGCTIWLSSDLQDEWRRLDALDERLSEILAGQGRTLAEPEVVPDLAANGAFEAAPETVPPKGGHSATRRVLRTPAS